MKTTVRSMAAVLAAILVTAACSNQEKPSAFEEFEMKDRAGNVHKCGAYLPAGYAGNGNYPLVIVGDGRTFTSGRYLHDTDSLIAEGIISPIVIACAYDINGHDDYIANDFIPAIEDRYSVMRNSGGRYFFGMGSTADLGLTLSMTNPGLIHEYWCIAPEKADMGGYGMLHEKVSYKICWGAREEAMRSFDYYPSLVQSLRKRGGSVSTWTFDSERNEKELENSFMRMLEENFAVE